MLKLIKYIRKITIIHVTDVIYSRLEEQRARYKLYISDNDKFLNGVCRGYNEALYTINKIRAEFLEDASL